MTASATALARSIKKVLKSAERRIAKDHPGIIGGEYHEFLAIHNAHTKKTASGVAVRSRSVGGRKTYYTRKQVLYK